MVFNGGSLGPCIMDNHGPKQEEILSHLIQVSDSVYVMEQCFDGVKVRGILVVGERRALVFDPLVSPHTTRSLRALCPGREIVVVYSHADWDHIWGACGLSPDLVIGHVECAKRFADPFDVAKTLDDYRTRYPFELSQVVLIPPHDTFTSTLTLSLGGISVELQHCPGHSRDSIVALIPERSLLLGGDCIELPIPLLNQGSENLSRWIDRLTVLEQETQISVCIPSHGAIGGREILRSNIEYLQSLLAEESVTPIGLDDFYTSAHRDNRIAAARLRSSR